MTKTWVAPNKIESLYKSKFGDDLPGINRPTSGARFKKNLESGDASVQLYSLATPNGQKVSIFFEELIEAGVDFQYDAHFINISEGDQFSSGFVSVNPNSRIPSCVDKNGPSNKSINLFETASICMYFAEKYALFIPTCDHARATMMNWVYWQMGSQGPMTGQFGHFFTYAPEEEIEARNYGVSRYGMETQRLCDLLDKQLQKSKFIVGNEYTVADILIYPWIQCLLNNYESSNGIEAKSFLSLGKYTHLMKWSALISERPAVKRGMRVCSWTEYEDKGTKPWLND